ncbi:hypothetical protein BaRGS_00029173 [Batillaria attramentaria]|uniref:Uncharacterized protein n=1 Tax=Batillaria attramentaria TaxID=370345 RepID=A0ABD0JY22_9CAEN
MLFYTCSLAMRLHPTSTDSCHVIHAVSEVHTSDVSKQTRTLGNVVLIYTTITRSFSDGTSLVSQSSNDSPADSCSSPGGRRR